MSAFVKKTDVLFLIVILFLLFPLLFPYNVEAIHKGAGGLVCGSCHTMHNSQGSSDLGGNAGGSIVLLRADVTSRAKIHNLCLQCHASNGSRAGDSHAPQNVRAPKVYSSGTWTLNDPFNQIGAGGNFSTELDATWTPTTSDTLGYGHSLGATNVMPPGGDALIDDFSCTSCHDPHGASTQEGDKVNMFRNLRVNAYGAGANSGVKLAFLGAPFRFYLQNISYVGGVSSLFYPSYFGGSETDNAGEVIWPVYRGTLTGNAVTDGPNSNAYGSPGFMQKDPPFNIGISNWCAQCHDNWHEAITITNKYKYADPLYLFFNRDWLRHPVSAMVPTTSSPGCAVNCHPSYLDRANYTTGLIQAGKGIPVTMHTQKLGPAATPPYPAVYYLEWAAPVSGVMEFSSPQIFCLTCHFAHGGPYYDNLRWEYLSSVVAGDQMPNPIASNIGCQLCHNR